MQRFNEYQAEMFLGIGESVVVLSLAAWARSKQAGEARHLIPAVGARTRTVLAADHRLQHQSAGDDEQSDKHCIWRNESETAAVNRLK